MKSLLKVPVKLPRSRTLNSLFFVRYNGSWFSVPTWRPGKNVFRKLSDTHTYSFTASILHVVGKPRYVVYSLTSLACPSSWSVGRHKTNIVSTLWTQEMSREADFIIDVTVFVDANICGEAKSKQLWCIHCIRVRRSLKLYNTEGVSPCVAVNLRT